MAQISLSTKDSTCRGFPSLKSTFGHRLNLQFGYIPAILCAYHLSSFFTALQKACKERDDDYRKYLQIRWLLHNNLKTHVPTMLRYQNVVHLVHKCWNLSRNLSMATFLLIRKVLFLEYDFLATYSTTQSKHHPRHFEIWTRRPGENFVPSLPTIVWNWKLKYPEYAVMLVLDGSIPSILLVEVLFRKCFFFHIYSRRWCNHWSLRTLVIIRSTRISWIPNKLKYFLLKDSRY